MPARQVVSESPTFWPPQVGDVWLSQLDYASPKAWVCTQPNRLAGVDSWDAQVAYEKFGPMKLIWRDSRVVTAMHSGELKEPTP